MDSQSRVALGMQYGYCDERNLCNVALDRVGLAAKKIERVHGRAR
jgi:hypothetical protein